MYKQNRNNPAKCEKKLEEIRQNIDEEFKKGKLNDQALSILEKRIDKYSGNLRQDVINKRFDLPQGLDRSIKNMLSDGIITKEEYDHFTKKITKAGLGAKEKEELKRMMKRWKDSDKK